MATPKSIGALELSSIGMGYLVEDEMLKAASVELLVARTICSGKYLIIIGGSVSDVQASIDAGVKRADEAIIDQLVLPNVHEAVVAQESDEFDEGAIVAVLEPGYLLHGRLLRPARVIVAR